MYHLVIIAGLSFAYVAFFLYVPMFFQKKPALSARVSLFSVLWIVLASVAVDIVSFQIPDEQIANRVMHIFGGGVISFLVFFLAVKDAKLKLGRSQFFILGFLLVATLGVFNEIIEFFLQQYAHVVFSDTVTDTWLDLTSNTIGALLGGAVLTPFIPRPRKRTARATAPRS